MNLGMVTIWSRRHVTRSNGARGSRDGAHVHPTGRTGHTGTVEDRSQRFREAVGPRIQVELDVEVGMHRGLDRIVQTVREGRRVGELAASVDG